MNLVLGGPVKEATGTPSLISTIVNLVPTNPIGAMANDVVLQVIVFALFFGYAMTKTSEKGRQFYTSLKALLRLCINLVR